MVLWQRCKMAEWTPHLQGEHAAACGGAVGSGAAALATLVGAVSGQVPQLPALCHDSKHKSGTAATTVITP